MRSDAKSAQAQTASQVPGDSLGGWRFDWTMIVLSAWLLGGAYVDGWAHSHGKVDDTFFTPWHALFYSGYLAVAVFLVASAVRNVARGQPWRQALPTGYAWSMIGALIFWFGGIGDMIWHILFGIEEDVEALFSPTHLLLAIGVWLIVSGPFRAAWQRADDTSPGWRQQLPMLLSAAMMLSTITFIVQIANPVSTSWVGGSIPSSRVVLFQEIGVMTFLWSAALLMSHVLVMMRRWTLVPGALTFFIAVNALGNGFLLSHRSFPLTVFVAILIAGVVIDVLYRQMQPSSAHPWRLRLFAFAVPAVVTGFYLGAVEMSEGLWWSVHLWGGMIVLSGIVGMLGSYLMTPPPLPSQTS